MRMDARFHSDRKRHRAGANSAEFDLRSLVREQGVFVGFKPTASLSTILVMTRRRL
jgi:hypothetical protein